MFEELGREVEEVWGHGETDAGSITGAAILGGDVDNSDISARLTGGS